MGRRRASSKPKKRHAPVVSRVWRATEYTRQRPWLRVWSLCAEKTTQTRHCPTERCQARFLKRRPLPRRDSFEDASTLHDMYTERSVQTIERSLCAKSASRLQRQNLTRARRPSLCWRSTVDLRQATLSRCRLAPCATHQPDDHRSGSVGSTPEECV